MNETYPNISVNSVRLSSDSCALEEEGASTKSAESPRGERERRAKGCGVCVSTRRPNRFQLGSVERWLCTNCPQLSFTSWLATRSRQIFPYGFAGKSYHRDGIKKIQMPRRMSFRGLRTSLSSVTRGGEGYWNEKRRKKKIEILSHRT